MYIPFSFWQLTRRNEPFLYQSHFYPQRETDWHRIEGVIMAVPYYNNEQLD